MSDFLNTYEREQERRKARLPVLQTTLAKLLRRAGAVEAQISYDGEGDSGQIDDVSAYDKARALVPDKPLSPRAKRAFDGLILFKDTLYGALEAFAWELLAEHHAGFENNDGAFGTITFDVTACRVTIEHSERISDVVTSQTEV